MPVMEGKAVLFKEFGGVDAFPLCLATKDVDEIVAVCTAVAPSFGGINLEDISAPRCFEIERRLRETLDIPVFHDDQHGTAIVVAGRARERAQGRRQADRGREDRDDRRRRGRDRDGRHPHARRRDRTSIGARPRGRGLPRPGRPHASRRRASPSARTRRTCRAPPTSCSPGQTCSSASRRRAPSRAAGVRTMARRRDRLRDGEPDARGDARGDRRTTSRSSGTGRSDYPNQINNVLAFPGVFRGALDVRGDRDHRGDEGRREPRDRDGDPRRRARPGVRRSPASSTATCAPGSRQRWPRRRRGRRGAREPVGHPARSAQAAYAPRGAMRLLVLQRLERVELRGAARREDRGDDPDDDRGDREDDHLRRSGTRSR